ncbi:MAG: MBL fold metallo-hydrolase [Humidesulfovibrio sp.]|uniref:MBL fold metallo-hydrolase n=1 Tax=Humidesulfovibrio sp. TaxID=2910988 RepID=UPI002732842D|nr:MBL fold metallo-hydrolase [Humidesulfovibrio sp.]MDP2848265.1 MBL fold metallo-hydrolase [Humidesulfovibrio sp.]
MKIRCWGARGSIPVSGPEYLRYGGDTACVEIRSKNDEILILDAGTGVRALGCELARQNRHSLTLLFSHYHWDHIQGLPFFKPLYNPKTELRLGGSRGAQRDLKRVLARALRPPFFPVPLVKVPATVSVLAFKDETLQVDSLRVRRIAASHPNGCAGFRIEEDGRSIVYLTDNELSLRHRGGLGYAEYVAFCQGADLLIHDTEYTPEEYSQRRGWGHSHYAEAALLAREAGVKTLGLFHHNQERTDEAQDKLLECCRGLLSSPGDPACLALFQGFSLDLSG